MNQNLFQIDNNRGIVSDENGAINFIEKENNSHSLEEILLKENDLEKLNLRLQNFKEKLLYNKRKMVESEFLNIFVLAGAIFLYIQSTLPTLISLSVLTCVYLSFKVMIICVYGTRMGRHKEKKKLTSDIAKMELDLHKVEKELAEMKEASKYKVSDNSKITAREICPEIVLDNTIAKEHNKIRVLSLVKRK